jgi:hypothetical protein
MSPGETSGIWDRGRPAAWPGLRRGARAESPGSQEEGGGSGPLPARGPVGTGAIAFRGGSFWAMEPRS